MSRHFPRKTIYYLCAIAVLLFPLYVLSQPATTKSSGGKLAQLRAEQAQYRTILFSLRTLQYLLLCTGAYLSVFCPPSVASQYPCPGVITPPYDDGGVGPGPYA